MDDFRARLIALSVDLAIRVERTTLRAKGDLTLLAEEQVLDHDALTAAEGGVATRVACASRTSSSIAVGSPISCRPIAVQHLPPYITWQPRDRVLLAALIRLLLRSALHYVHERAA